MNRCLIAAVAWTVFSVGNAAQAPITDSDAYAVYAALLPNEWPIRVAKATRPVLRRETVTNWTCMASGTVLQTDWKPVVDSFRRENATPRVLLPGFLLDPPYMLVSSADIKSALPSFDWRPFYRLYPDSGGYMEVSAVGFDEGKTRAMVYVAHHCGGLCGGGSHHFLEKRDGRWRSARLDVSVCLWVS
jgi:hypothetical protein